MPKILIGDVITLDESRFDLSKYKKLNFMELFFYSFRKAYQ